MPLLILFGFIAGAATAGGFARVIATGPGDRGLVDGLVAHFAVRNHNTYPG